MDSFTDIENFNQLFNEYYSPFIRFAQGYVKEKETAEDFVPETFAAYWEHRRELIPERFYLLTHVSHFP